MMKIIGIFIAVIVVIAILVSGCVQEQKYTGPVEKITVAAFAGTDSGLIYIAKNQGYFEENGLDVTIKDYEAGKLAAEALLVGEADISTTADVAFVGKSFDNPDIRILGAIDQGFLHEIVARKDKGITNPTDLAGKKIGVTKGTTGEFFLGTFLTFNGLSLKDVEVVDLKPSEIVDAINKGEIDAGSTWNPFVYQIKQNFGDEVVGWESQCGQPMYFILLTKEKWLNENKETAERFIRSLIQAEEFIKQNNIEARDILTQELGFESSYHNAIWKNYELSITLPQALLIAMEDQARWRIKQGLTDATEVPNYLDYIYPDALERVKPEAIGIIR